VKLAQVGKKKQISFDRLKGGKKAMGRGEGKREEDETSYLGACKEGNRGKTSGGKKLKAKKLKGREQKKNRICANKGGRKSWI